MATNIRLYQGEDKTIVVKTNISLTGSTQIEFRIDTPKQIIKTKTGGGITGITSTQFSVAIVVADTTDVKAGAYKYQVVSTASGGAKTNGKFSPNKITIEDSIFVNQGSGKDYN